MPRVSVVMAVKNGERFVTAAIESVLGQTFADFQLIVVDDGSTDATPGIVDALPRAVARVSVIHQDNAGPAAARDSGVTSAHTPLIAILDGDDVIAPDRLERQVAFLNEHPDVGIVGGAADFIDDDGRVFATVEYPVTDADIHERLATASPFVHSAVTMRRDLFVDLGGYRRSFESAQDLDLWLRVAERTSMANLPSPAVCSYRLHHDQMTQRKLDRQALGATAARVVARLRAAGAPDPFTDLATIEEDAVFAAGGSRAELTATYIGNALWLARTMSKAGQSDVAWPILDRAAEVADTAELRATVRRVRAGVHRQAGHRWRALAAQWVRV